MSSREQWPLSFRLQYSGRMSVYEWGELGPPETLRRGLWPHAVRSETAGHDRYKSASKSPQCSHVLFCRWNYIFASVILCWEKTDRTKINGNGRRAFSSWYLKFYQELKPWFKIKNTKQPNIVFVDFLVRFASVGSFGHWLVLRIFIQPGTSNS